MVPRGAGTLEGGWLTVRKFRVLHREAPGVPVFRAVNATPSLVAPWRESKHHAGPSWPVFWLGSLVMTPEPHGQKTTPDRRPTL